MTDSLTVYTEVFTLSGGLLNMSRVRRNEDGDLVVGNFSIKWKQLAVDLIRSNPNNSIKEFFAALRWCKRYNKNHNNKAYVSFRKTDKRIIIFTTVDDWRL